MLESVLLVQQKQYEDIVQLAFKVDLLTTHNKMLEIQIAQQASSFSIALGKLPRKPKLPQETLQCQCARKWHTTSGSFGVKSQRNMVRVLPHYLMRMSPKKERVRDQRCQSPFPKSHTCPPCHFHKDLLKLSLILNLASFFIC